MNSEGCRLISPSDSQRRAPLTSRPTPGMSTRMSRTTVITNSHGAARCHRRTGIWKTIMPARTLAPRKAACRNRKYRVLPPVNRLASATAIEAEYTITRPTVSSRIADQRTLASYSGIWPRPGLARFSIAESLHRGAEYLPTMRIVAEHVEARARRRQKHCVSGPRLLGRARDGFFHRLRAMNRKLRAADRGFDQRSVATDQDHRARSTRERFAQRREILAFALAARD